MVLNGSHESSHGVGFIPSIITRRPKFYFQGQSLTPSTVAALVTLWLAFEKLFLTQGPRQLHSWKVSDCCVTYHNNLLFLLSVCRQSRWTLVKGLCIGGTQSTILSYLRFFMQSFFIPLDLAPFWNAITFTRMSLWAPSSPTDPP